MSDSEHQPTRVGDFRAGGRPSIAGDAPIDKRETAETVATGDWEYEVHTENVVAWHIPGQDARLQLRAAELGWVLSRAIKQVGPRQETLQEGFDLAAEYMADHTEGQPTKRWTDRTEENGDE